jgi:hypothetical protein
MGRDCPLPKRTVRRREEKGAVELPIEKAATERGLRQTAQRIETSKGKGE